MRECIEVAGGSNVLYANPDALHVTYQGLQRLVDAGECDQMALGRLKVQAQGDDAFYWGPHFYRVGNHFVSNVLRPSDREVAEGIFLQSARDGIGTTIRTAVLDRVLVREKRVTLPYGRELSTITDNGGS